MELVNFEKVVEKSWNFVWAPQFVTNNSNFSDELLIYFNGNEYRWVGLMIPDLPNALKFLFLNHNHLCLLEFRVPTGQGKPGKLIWVMESHGNVGEFWKIEKSWKS